MSADATHQGAGGEVVLWSDVHAEGGLTTAAGTLSARGISQGGRIETSGHAVDTDGARVDAGASSGAGGQWLIDPYNYTINAPQAATIVSSLNTGTSVTVDTTVNNPSQGATGAGSGDIVVNAVIAKTAGGDATLTLKADNNISVNASLTSNTGKLGVVLWADQDNSGAGSIQVINVPITSNGGDVVMGGGLDGNADGRPDGAAIGDHGIYMDGVALNAGAGNITLRGASNQTTSAWSTGINVESSILSARVVTLTGTGATNTGANGGNVGVLLNTSSITASEDLFIGGTGGGSGSTGGDNHGVLILGAGVGTVTGTGSGTVTISGTGGGQAGSSNNDGVVINDATIRSASGALAINGTQGVGSSSEGLEMNTGVLGAASGQSGAITVTSNSMYFLGINTLQTTGAAVVESAGASFDSGGIGLGLSVVNASSLRIGKTTNTADLFLTQATTVAGPISIYGGHIYLNALMTSTATGDILFKSVATTGADSIFLNNNIAKTGGARSVLTLQSAGRITLNGGTGIGASGTVMDVVLWSDYGNANVGGITLQGHIGTNGGHLWMGGSSTAGGSLKWNGLTVGDGPAVSAASANLNAIEVTGQINTAGGDMLLWAGPGQSSNAGIKGATANPLTTGSGDITLLANSVATLPVSTTGLLTLAPYNGNYSGTMTWSGAMSGADLALTGTYDGLTLKNMTSLGGLTLGQYSGMLQPLTLAPVVMGNSDNITMAVATTVAGPIRLYGNNITLNTNLASTAAGAQVMLQAATTITQSANVAVSSQGGSIIYVADSDANGSGAISVGPGAALTTGSGGGAIDLWANNTLGAIGIDLNGATVDAGLGFLTLTGAGTTQAVRVGAGSTVSAADIAIMGTGEVRLDSALTATAGSIWIEADRFVNTAGSGALNVTNGLYNWTVWSRNADPFNATTGDVRDGLVYDYKQYNYVSGDNIQGSGDGLLYSYAPVVTVALTGGVSKGYDGSDSATLAAGNYQYSGLVDGDSVTLGVTATRYDNKNAGSGKTVSATGLSLDGASNGAASVYGYQLASTAANGAIGTITPKAISAITGITAASKVYDGSTVATLTTSGAGFTGMVGGDALTVATGSGAFADKNVGTGKTVAITGLSLGGTDAGNYTLTDATATTTADITPKAISAITGITAASKVYDGSTVATLTTSGAGFTGMVGGDALNVASSSGAFADKNAELGKTVSISGLSLGGADASNYTLTSATATSTADITPKAISAITGITAADKVYDGGTAATLTTSGAGFTGMVGGDALTVASGTGAFADKHVGNGKTVAISGLSLGGADAGNYLLADTTANASAAITPKAITAITGITAADRVYDGSSAAQLDTTAAGFTGLVGDDALSVASGTGAFADKHVGNGKTVAISDLSLGGADAGNYLLADTTASTSATITPKAITAITGITAADKIYDGGTAATLTTSGTDFTGMVGGDALSVASGTGVFADKHAGSGKTVTISGLSLGGADAGNYLLADTTASASADITPKLLTLTGVAAADKMYDGGVNATLSHAGSLVGVVGADAVAFTHTGASFADPQVGRGKTVSLTGLTLSGADAGNYSLDPTGGQTLAAINRLPDLPWVDDGEDSAGSRYPSQRPAIMDRDQSTNAALSLLMVETELQQAPPRDAARRLRFEAALEGEPALACDVELVGNQLLVRANPVAGPTMAPALRKRLINEALAAVEKTFGTPRQHIALTTLSLTE
ncbi:MAG: YDG domain-containing protein [Proteobacteria bacterium]|nr:YDG domain-containing protein [Pseudomonadota bacterium]